MAGMGDAALFTSVGGRGAHVNAGVGRVDDVGIAGCRAVRVGGGRGGGLLAARAVGVIVVAALALAQLAPRVWGADEAAAFPIGRFGDTACASAPFGLRWVRQPAAGCAAGAPAGAEGEAGAGAGTGALCFVMRRRPTCASAVPRYDCCARLGATVEKIALETRPACVAAISHVTLNGTRKGGGVYAQRDGDARAELRITALRMPAATLLATRFCVHLQATAATAAAGCGPSPAALGAARYALITPTNHDCGPACPTRT